MLLVPPSVQGPYVMAGCADGGLHVWSWENNMEICHIAAHKQRVNHCCLLKNTGKLHPLSDCLSLRVTKLYFDQTAPALVSRQES